MGPPRSLTEDQEAQLIDEWLSGEYTQAQLAARYGVGLGVAKLAIYRVVRPDAPYLVSRPRSNRKRVR